MMILAAFLAPLGSAATIYVDDSATGANSGSSWANAFTDLHFALAVAQGGDEIWVAQGRYTPSATMQQTTSFQLKDAVKIFGGFAGTEATLAERAGLFDDTVLSGDLLDDDGPGPFDNSADNSLHVVVATSCGPDTLLDGLTISSGSDPLGVGGGALRILGGGPTLRSVRFKNCQVIGNNPQNLGGAVYCEQGSPTFTSCRFIDNQVYRASSIAAFVTSAGGAVYLRGGVSVFRSCFFSSNAAIGPFDALGGAICATTGAALTLDHCDFENNQAAGCCVSPPSKYPYAWGGAVSGGDFGQKLLAIGCRFLGNTSAGTDVSHGGALSWHGLVDNTVVQDCLFSGNQVGPSGYSVGTAIYGYNLPIVNCTIANNVGNLGGDVIAGGTSNSVTNSIVWGNVSTFPGAVSQISGSTTVNYSCVEAYTGGGVGNITLDPMFVNPNGADGISGTDDDDLRLQAGSPAIDSGDRLAVPPDILDADGDGDLAEPNPFDVEGTTRFWDDLATVDRGNGSAPIVDMGAHEYHGDHCEQNLGFQGPGNVTLNICGDDLTTLGSTATLQIAGAPPLGVVFLFAGLTNAPLSIPGTSGTLVSFPPLPGFPLVLPINAIGNLSLPITGGVNSPLVVYLQGITQNGSIIEFSNALELILGS